MHVHAEHLEAALAAAADGPVEEGCVGSGTGMICHGFKGGIGTSSRRGDWTVGVLVQANHGRRSRLTIDGVPVGRELGPERIPAPGVPEGAGSIIVLPNDAIDSSFYATIEATEEAIVNALLAAETTTGRGGRVVHRLDPDALVEVMRRYGRL
jgi:L-aminopeptidase/D-esterase-like protein